jgi:hypothetical protein
MIYVNLYRKLLPIKPAALSRGKIARDFFRYREIHQQIITHYGRLEMVEEEDGK